jgi:hypothetical protein
MRCRLTQEYAIDLGLNQKLDSRGKTPAATLGARLYIEVRDNPTSKFTTIGKRPKRFMLKGRDYKVDLKKYSDDKIEEKEDFQQLNYLEKDLHDFLTYFVSSHLKCFTKTINHSKSTKKQFGEWVHPDMVGCVFPIEEWDEEVFNLSTTIGNTSIKLLSFELKQTLSLSSLRENFFQTVSNSSWANEGYLVAAEISQDEDFLNELKRLSTSFGIGIIRLDVEDPNASEIILPAREKDLLDWDTINKLTMNKDFKEFLKRIRIDLQSKEIRKEMYDRILSETELGKKLKSPAQRISK